MPGLGVAAGDARARLVQLRDRRVEAGADVVRAAAVTDRCEQRGDDVADVDEVAAVHAVAVDDRLVAARHALEEDRDDAALEAGVLARAVDVREAERDVRAAVDAIPAGEVLLAALLGDAVGRQRQERRLLVGGRGALAVARAARGGEDHLCAVRGREDVHRADDVDRRVVVRALHRRLDVGLRREVEDDVGVDRERLADVVLEQRRGGVHVLALAGGEVVDDRHVVAARDERVDEIRPDEARTACDDRPHGGRRLVPRCS